MTKSIYCITETESYDAVKIGPVCTSFVFFLIPSRSVQYIDLL